MFKFNAISYMFVFRILISVCFGEKSFSRKKGGGGFVFMAFPVLGVCVFLVELKKTCYFWVVCS